MNNIEQWWEENCPNNIKQLIKEMGSVPINQEDIKWAQKEIKKKLKKN
jgi:hypothetical protein